MASSSKGKSKSKSSRVRGYSGKGSGLKANNAGYSTTNRKGETTYFKSSKDAGGYNDSFEGKGTTSAGNPLKTVDSGGTTITSESMKPTQKVDIATPVVTPVADYTANNVGLTGGTTSITQTGNNLTVAPPDEFQGLRDNQSSYQEALDRITGEQPSAADIQRKVEKESGIKKYREEASNLAAQLNTITANRDAEMLGLEGQGRGITESIIGGQQERISREAAIKALPLQALLAQAQGNVALAQDHINTWGQILMNDATNKYNAKRDTLKSMFDLTQGIEQQKVAQLQEKEKRTYAEKQALINAKTQALSNAAGQGASSAIQNAIRNATTMDGVVAAAGIYNGDVLGQEAKRLQIKQANANLYTESLQQQKLLAELNPTGDPGASADLEAYGGEFASTGKLPSPAALKAANLTAGQVSAYAKQVPKSVGTLVSKNTGATPTGIGAAEQDDIKRLYNITQMTAQLAELDKKRVGGLVAGGFGKLFGSEAQGAYLTQRKAIVDEIARMQTGAALTNDEQAFYNDYLPGRLSESFGLGQGSDKKIENFSKLMNDKLNNSLANNQLSVFGYSKVNVPGLGNKTVGDVIEVQGNQYRVLPDGTLTDVI